MNGNLLVSVHVVPPCGSGFVFIAGDTRLIDLRGLSREAFVFCPILASCHRRSARHPVTVEGFGDLESGDTGEPFGRGWIPRVMDGNGGCLTELEVILGLSLPSAGGFALSSSKVKKFSFLLIFIPEYFSSFRAYALPAVRVLVFYQ
jgi:hypothetical protein